MNPSAARFARLGAALLVLAGALARGTKGAFPPGPAAIALGVAVAVTEAARNAFAALGSLESTPTLERAALLEVAAAFRKGAGVLATRMPGPRGGASVPSLAGFSAIGRDAGGLADYFDAALPTSSIVSVDEGALAALGALRRDALVLAAEGPESLLLLLDTVSDGVAVFGMRAQ